MYLFKHKNGAEHHVPDENLELALVDIYVCVTEEQTVEAMLTKAELEMGKTVKHKDWTITKEPS